MIKEEVQSTCSVLFIRWMLAAVLVLALVVFSSAPVHAGVVDFEDLDLPSESFYAGADGAGGFGSRSSQFNNLYTDLGGGMFAWTGWSYSNMTDTVAPGYENQFSAVTGGGDGSANYGVAYAYSPGDSTIELPPSTAPISIQVTNTTYAYRTMLNGDAYTDPFGGPAGDEPDYFLLTITGLDRSGAVVGTVEQILADYRFDNHAEDYILDTWSEIDLTELSGARTLSFGLESSDVGSYGMNTPAYFAVDNLNLTPEPATSFLLAAGSLVLLCRRRLGPRKSDHRGAS